MTDPADRETGYVLGHSMLEHRRLLIQASYVRPWTERFLRGAGVSEGMTVLDIGSGLGDSSFVAAEIVGPSGRVVGVEQDPATVESARRHVVVDGYADIVRFENVELAEFATTDRFDALVGRFILQYLPGSSRRAEPPRPLRAPERHRRDARHGRQQRPRAVRPARRMIIDDSLAATLERAVLNSRSMVVGNTHYGAWVRLDKRPG